MCLSANINSKPGRPTELGITLIECLVYISVLFVVLGAAYSVFHGFEDSSRDLTRNSQDIIRVLRAGERWRDDVRAAVGPVRIDPNANRKALHIPTDGGEIVYEFAGDTVFRFAGSPMRMVGVRVAKSEIHVDESKHVKSLRWEVELVSRRKSPRVRPLFTFHGVPGAGVAP